MSRSSLRPSSICADCSAADPTWASINRGVLICDECCSVHRSLGRHVSQVRSIRRGQWSPTQHAMLYQLANHGANNIWEHQLKDPSQNKHGRKKPSCKDPLHPNKADFIRAKYQFLSFVNKQKESDVNSIDDVSKELHSSVRTNNVETCLRLLSKGADPNYFHKEKGNNPLHVAAQAGQVAQVELLVVYGADPGAIDINQKTPIDYARLGGFHDVADRLIECQYELTDRLAFHVCGRKPDHRSGQNFIIPEIGDNSALDLSELDKQAKKKLQALSNHLFEELAMDVYDEVDRRENDKIWLETQDHTTVSDRTTVPFLPVNPDLSTTRNQGRQKLARFNKREFTTLIIDILNDARRRQTGITSPVQTPKDPNKSLSYIGLPSSASRQSKVASAFSDEEPLYDSVASDDDYSSIDTRSVQSMRVEMKKDKPADVNVLRGLTPTSMISFTESMTSEAIEGPVSTDEYMEVKKALAGAESTIQNLVHRKTDLEQKVHIMQSTIESLLRENASLRDVKIDRTSDDGQVLNGYGREEDDEISQGLIEGKYELKVVKARPQSMFEARDKLRSSQRNSDGKDDQIMTAMSVSNIHLGENQLSLQSEEPTLSESDRINANVKDPDYDMLRQDQDPIRGDIASSMIDSTSSIQSMPGAVAIPLVLPVQEDVVRKTEKITKRIQELLIRAQEGNVESYNPCSDRIYMAVTEMDSLFPKKIQEEEVYHALQLLKDSAARLKEECRKLSSSSNIKQSTSQVIQCAYDVAKAAKQLVTLFQ
ncbi:ARF GTPase-activating protein GIT2 isoform X1 [Patella vulgata]|uniref:ARF GTPase-activating protein GIT2 isoform X1 n=2 Tax=Patella vulgata TaxID=6465 RepID=UPI00217FE0EB|nr:ARF GTPase-activating protein GIT2 isoform X1 [Patella vulgata]